MNYSSKKKKSNKKKISLKSTHKKCEADEKYHLESQKDGKLYQRQIYVF